MPNTALFSEGKLRCFPAKAGMLKEKPTKFIPGCWREIIFRSLKPKVELSVCHCSCPALNINNTQCCNGNFGLCLWYLPQRSEPGFSWMPASCSQPCWCNTTSWRIPAVLSSLLPQAAMISAGKHQLGWSCLLPVEEDSLHHGANHCSHWALCPCLWQKCRQSVDYFCQASPEGKSLVLPAVPKYSVYVPVVKLKFFSWWRF